MLSKNEINLIKLIKYTPAIIVILVCAITTALLYIDKNIALDKDLKSLENEYLERNQKLIKVEVDNVHSYIIQKKLEKEEELKNDLKQKVYEAHNIMTYIYEKYKNKESDEQIKNRIKDSLKALRFNDNRGYFYINSMDGNSILHPNNELEGTFVLNYEDETKTKIFKKIIEELRKQDEVYSEYYWNKLENNDSKTKYKKLSFNKIFKPYNWHIGTGEYLDDFDKKMKAEILDYIGKLRYSTNGYIFVVDKDGTYLSHIEKSYIGLNRIDLKDPNGFMITREIIRVGKNGGGFLKYIGTIKPETKMPSEKTTYAKNFEPWDWSIATGFYTDELEKQIDDKKVIYKEKYMNNLFNIFMISGIVTLLFLSVSFYLSKQLEKRFNKYKQQVLNHAQKNREKDSMLAQKSKMEAMGEMIENIAHQWRQPLNTISTISTGITVQYQYGIVEKEQILHSMETISNTTKYLSHTIDDFREYFNPDKKASYFNLKNTIEKALDLIIIQLNRQNIQVVKDLDDVYIYALENELLQVIINVINNSKDEYERKELKEKFIFITLKDNENDVEINIKDNAGGIDDKIIGKIFEPYFTTKSKNKGTGIGLYMSKEIIQKHMSGKILVVNEHYVYEDKDFKGARFDIFLPKSESQSS